MKKLRFLLDVQDIYNGNIYTKNQVVEFNNKRADEILAKRRNNGEPYAKEVTIETATRKDKSEKAIKDSDL